jgi:hypothetical protein
MGLWLLPLLTPYLPHCSVIPVSLKCHLFLVIILPPSCLSTFLLPLYWHPAVYLLWPSAFSIPLQVSLSCKSFLTLTDFSSFYFHIHPSSYFMIPVSVVPCHPKSSSSNKLFLMRRSSFTPKQNNGQNYSFMYFNINFFK